jgi:hypothetical protein
LFAKITALYRLRLLSEVTSSVQSTTMPSASSQLFSAFWTMCPEASGGFRPAARRGPMLACRGPAVRVKIRTRFCRVALAQSW